MNSAQGSSQRRRRPRFALPREVAKVDYKYFQFGEPHKKRFIYLQITDILQLVKIFS
jgi:hypothetical protein